MVDRGAVLIGCGLFLYGVQLLSVPAAFILGGVLLVAGALWRLK